MAEASPTSSGSKPGAPAVVGGSGSAGIRAAQEPLLKVGIALSDERVDFLREQVFCVLRVKTDKWNRFIGTEENQKVLLDFLDHIWDHNVQLRRTQCVLGVSDTRRSGMRRHHRSHVSLL
ncbi:hypothetical protein NHX12_034280 [Muraenolepis orangiensis]|uniref:Uncharacterized protein n=1 Tax=Muraenolepis orangiensis TaxID=630683 RepID=A0A9Q0I0A5_9TELE|nr:hypothetical protein NHX12_034280 [Muraenolepis orangiensis]